MIEIQKGIYEDDSTACNIFIFGWGMVNDMEFIHQYFDPLPYVLVDLQLTVRRQMIKQLRLSAVAHHYFGVGVEKKYQNADWHTRPISADQLLYAMEDTRWVFRIFQKVRGLVTMDDVKVPMTCMRPTMIRPMFGIFMVTSWV